MTNAATYHRLGELFNAFSLRDQKCDCKAYQVITIIQHKTNSSHGTNSPLPLKHRMGLYFWFWLMPCPLPFHREYNFFVSKKFEVFQTALCFVWWYSKRFTFEWLGTRCYALRLLIVYRKCGRGENKYFPFKRRTPTLHWCWISVKIFWAGLRIWMIGRASITDKLPRKNRRSMLAIAADLRLTFGNSLLIWVLNTNRTFLWTIVPKYVFTGQDQCITPIHGTWPLHRGN